jgi:DNA helicase-2/ATP-dependent DNA helicase PcrA
LAVKCSPANTSELTLGRKVNHEKFGVGTIVSVSEADGKKKLTIAFNNQGVKMLMVPPAKLELL